MRFLPIWLLLVSSPANSLEVSFSADRVSAPGFSAQKVRAKLAGSSLSIEAAQADFAGRKLIDPRIGCSRFSLDNHFARCGAGLIKLDESWPFSLGYAFSTDQLDLQIDPAPGEAWRARYGTGGFDLDLAKARLSRLGPWLGPSIPKLNAGFVDGRIALSAKNARAALEVSNAGFSDPFGLHAGEKISGALHLDAKREGASWRFSDSIEVGSGEMFWQPFYFKGGQRFSGGGSYDGKRLVFDDSTLAFPGIGRLDGSMAIDLEKKRIDQANFKGERLKLAELNGQILKPLLRDTSFSEMSMRGEASIAVSIRDFTLQGVDLSLAHADIDDQKGRFALHELHAEIPWDANLEREAAIGFEDGKLFRIPLGKTELPFRMHGDEFSARHLTIPVADGRLNIDNFSARNDSSDWHWEFSGGLTPVSMPGLSQALGIPSMQGTLSGVIPKVSFADLQLSVDGALLFKVFDGTVVAQHLRMLDPFGPAPRLGVDLDMKNLDLGMLTRTFSFGSMEGRIDASVKSLELVNWQPVKFDAVLQSSPGDYPKKISQRAVQNISALGGAGAAAAIQRSFLSMFKKFGYEKVGFSCKLAGGVCEMGGIEAVDSGYLLVKGGGIPAVTVIGYNRNIGWDELVTRLKRIAAQNVKPIVK